MPNFFGDKNYDFRLPYGSNLPTDPQESTIHDWMGRIHVYNYGNWTAYAQLSEIQSPQNVMSVSPTFVLNNDLRKFPTIQSAIDYVHDEHLVNALIDVYPGVYYENIIPICRMNFQNGAILTNISDPTLPAISLSGTNFLHQDECVITGSLRLIKSSAPQSACAAEIDCSSPLKFEFDTVTFDTSYPNFDAVDIFKMIRLYGNITESSHADIRFRRCELCVYDETTYADSIPVSYDWHPRTVFIKAGYIGFYQTPISPTVAEMEDKTIWKTGPMTSIDVDSIMIANVRFGDVQIDFNSMWGSAELVYLTSGILRLRHGTIYVPQAHDKTVLLSPIRIDCDGICEDGAQLYMTDVRVELPRGSNRYNIPAVELLSNGASAILYARDCAFNITDGGIAVISGDNVSRCEARLKNCTSTQSGICDNVNLPMEILEAIQF